MTYPLDTHVFLWMGREPENLSAPALAIVSNPEHRLVLSVIGLWEIAIKTNKGLLKIEADSTTS